MKPNKRWMQNTVNAAAERDVKMPWERGARRSAFIASRAADDKPAAPVSLAPLPNWLTEAIRA
ncbi:hypothetical protein [Cognatiyoonia sp.]|uniref:hypothetical protein n=1 Tax=Cognatiyoonia sp. TaxID=2211652 RepID=UPI003F696C3C